MSGADFGFSRQGPEDHSFRHSRICGLVSRLHFLNTSFLTLAMQRLSNLLQDKLKGGPPEGSATTSYPYRPLDANSIRVVELQPRAGRQGSKNIVCRLTHVTFGDRPKYYALSYAWGDSLDKQTILIDDIKIEVGQTLAAALVNIRGLESAREQPQMLWIDAICINQSDIAERSSQVRLMPFIYTRAQMVLVWLGSKFTFKDQPEIEPKPAPGPVKHRTPGSAPHTPIEKIVILNLCQRPYWKRLWIIQEIGKARCLRICYDSTSMEWDHFIENVNSYNEFKKYIPWKLAAQLRGQYDADLKLSSLLRANHQALCQNPRDKIYGLLGLATDVNHTFPIDYSKSLFEVFADTIFFLNRDEDRSPSQHDILQMSRLISRALGDLQPVESPRSFSAGDISLESTSAQTRYICVAGRLAGRISCVGPFHRDLMAGIESSDMWKSLILSNISDTLRSAVLEQSDLFIERLECFDEVSQTTVFAFENCLTWQENQQHSLEAFERTYNLDVDLAGPNTLIDPLDHGCRLFLLQPPAPKQTDCWMGLAPRGTRVGDFVCYVAGIERAVIIRQLLDTNYNSPQCPKHYLYRIIGCAGLARDRDMARQVRGVSLPPSYIFDTGTLSPLIESEQLNFYTDIYSKQQ